LSVKLTDAETGKPLAGVKVVASCSPTGRTEATTNNSGMCTFNNLYAGSCWIDFYKDMYQNNETRVYLYKGSNTLAAYTSKITATINLLEPTPGGTVNPAPGVYKFRGGETAKFTALAKNGYEFDCWHKDYGTWGEIYYDSILSFNITGYNSYFRNLSAGFKCIMPALSPHNPPAQAKTPAPSGTNITIKRLRYAYSEVCSSGWQDVPINAPTGSKISLELDWDASNTKVYMKNFNVKWFVKRPDGTVEEVPQVVMGYTYSGAGFVADQVGGYSVTAVLTGTPDGVNWYELGRKSG
ncbi:MAG: carboxypeptidase-like regulatory domain-containing protein, partial [Candidatus Aenigmarchaeota archaeon]|nr:carboxypeptidase-like regulatory domain-containing protein [Candidatus Aenigmarchaeota archaeon]